LRAWKIAALFHDIGYTCDKGIDQEEEFLRPLLSQLQDFTDYPLRLYFGSRGFDLSEKEETDLARISNRLTPKVLTLDSIELLPLPGPEKRSLNLIENLAVSTRLAQKGHETPLQNYYALGKTVKPRNRERFRDHGILSALILLHQFHYMNYCLQILNDMPLPDSINRDTLEELTRLVANPVTLQYIEIVHQAAAAMALHNVNVDIWNIDKAKDPPYYLSLSDYRIALDETPLGFLLALTDVLQCWDRPKRRYESKPEGLSIRSQDVRITCRDDTIYWSIKPDRDAKKQLISPSEEIKAMSKYMSYRGKRDLSSLIREMASP
jgi:hypothetical protein